LLKNGPNVASPEKTPKKSQDCWGGKKKRGKENKYIKRGRVRDDNEDTRKLDQEKRKGRNGRIKRQEKNKNKRRSNKRIQT